MPKIRFSGIPGAVPSDGGHEGENFREFDATELYCQRCRKAVPVRRRLLLVLPEGEKFEYLCAFCSASVGTKMARQEKKVSVLI